MSEFDDALTRAAQDAAERGRLPGAADAVRRGRRRTLRARGGVAVAGVAAVGGALGVTAALGGPAGAAPGGGTVGAAHADDGLLQPELWPGYDQAHWKPKKLVQPNLVNLSQIYYGPCPVSPDPNGGPSVRNVVFSGGEFEGRLDAFQEVFTFSDSARAATVLAGLRTAGSTKACRGGTGADAASPGVNTEAGVSWLWRQTAADGARVVTHSYAVQVGDRVTLLRISWTSTGTGTGEGTGTGADSTVLEHLQAALSR
ncbi:hypothetical protein GCM10009839_72870 [Catenulispora yoronensis]|uniref:PknH-like extracellular domain-containing protein n=1 Tax=Catenulispora yoronensis TaxID=450799 RepID=A0ABP5GTY5_9ACTN